MAEVLDDYRVVGEEVRKAVAIGCMHGFGFDGKVFSIVEVTASAEFQLDPFKTPDRRLIVVRVEVELEEEPEP